MHIGFIGLGAMGQAMAGRLLKAGHSLSVYNRTQAKAAALMEQGAQLAESPRLAAADADVVVSMAFDDNAMESITFGSDGIMEGLPAGGIHVCCSTLSMAMARTLSERHREHGQHYVSAPVLGRPPAALEGQLFTAVAGDSAVVDGLTGLFEAYSQRIFRAGEQPEQANLIKLCLNSMILSTIEQMGEMFSLCEKGGVEPATFFEIMTNSFYSAPVHKNYGKLMVEQQYAPPGAPMSVGHKDTRLLLQAAEALEVPLPYASVVRDRLLAANAAGDGGLDFVALYERARQDAGLKQ